MKTHIDNTIEEIKELDAIINLYKDDPADGLRNKLWVWHKAQSKRYADERVREFIKWLNALEEDWLIKNLPNRKERMQIGSIENARRFAQQFLNQNTESKDHSFLGNICRHCGATREQTVIKCVGEYKPTPNTESEKEIPKAKYITEFKERIWPKDLELDPDHSSNEDKERK